MPDFANMNRVFSADFVALCKSFDTMCVNYGIYIFCIIIVVVGIVFTHHTFELTITEQNEERDEMRRNGLL